MTSTMRTTAALFILLFVSGTSLLNAQSAWLPPTERTSVSVETYRLDRPSQLRSFNGTAIFITGRFLHNNGITFVLELPFARSDKHRIFLNGNPMLQKSQIALGNVYFGISLSGKRTFATTFDIGMRFPLAEYDKRSAQSIGQTIDFDRWESFALDLLLVRAHVGRRWSKPNNPLSVWIRGGGTILHSNFHNTADLFFDYQARVLYKSGRTTFSTIFVGRTLLSNRYKSDSIGPFSSQVRISLTESSEFLLGFGANFTIGHFKPGVSARFPINKNGLFSLRSNVNAVYGLNITYLFGGNNKKESDWR